ncbi:hypothetical protein [Streptomyces sp. NPDC050848]|uniref:hypothetical protein n=1 Tax=Streptomyces sp. NPDC050848 TaxID=3155791 RepID=UPI0033CB9F90
MTLTEGQRVKLAEDLRLSGQVVRADESSTDPASDTDSDPDTGWGAGFLALGAGIPGTVERMNEHRREKGQEVREYERLTSLLDDFGHQMPPGSRKQLEEQVASLKPAWERYQEHEQRVTVRVRFDNGFVLDEAPADLFTPA